MRLITFIFVLPLLVLTGCSKESFDEAALGDEQGGIELIYQETQCADPWDQIEIQELSPGSNQGISQLLAYMEIHGLEVFSVNYEFDSNIITCLECHCKSGGIFILRVVDDENTIQTLLSLGFVYP